MLGERSRKSDINSDTPQWEARNPWFADQVQPDLRRCVAHVLTRAVHRDEGHGQPGSVEPDADKSHGVDGTDLPSGVADHGALPGVAASPCACAST